MRRFPILIIALFICSYVKAQLNPLYFGRPDNGIINNKVIRDDTYEIKIKGSKTDSSLIDSIVYKYSDDPLKVTTAIIYRKDFNGQYVAIRYSYYASGWVKKAILDFPSSKTRALYENAGLKFFTTTEYEYDSNGKVKAEANYSDDTTRLQVTRNQFDSVGRVIKVSTQYNNQPVKLSKTYTYDDKGRLATEIDYANDGTIDREFEFTYDEGAHSESTFFIKKDNEKLVEKTFFDNAHRTSRVIHSPGENNETIEKYIYNNDGTINSLTTYANKKVIRIIRHYYKKL